MDFYSETPCKHCGGCGREPDIFAIKLAVKASGLTQKAVARKLNISPQHLGDLLCGTRRWAPASLEKLRQIIGNPQEE